MAKETKTNAMRILERLGIPYTARTYDSSDGKINKNKQPIPWLLIFSKCHKTAYMLLCENNIVKSSQSLDK